MFSIRAALRGSLSAAALLALAACAPSTYNVKAPEPSQLKSEIMPSSGGTLSLIDKRQDGERLFHSGILAATLNYDSAPIDPPKFLAENLQAELGSRGYATQVYPEDKGQPRLNVKTFRIQNHRVSGYSPFVTFTFLSADLETPAGPRRIASFVKRGKVPVWSFDEIIEPTLNQPLSLTVKEMASKVAGELYGFKASDATVDTLAAKLGARNENSYLDVYALGFTNNPRAVETLVKLTKDADEYVRLAAISSLGNLRATSQFDLLRSIYESAEVWQDRGMAIKAIGDFGTDESRAYLAEQMKRWEGQVANNEAVWTMQIIRLYL